MMPPSQRTLIDAARRFSRWLGIERAPVSHAERIIAAAGGMIAIYALVVIEASILGGPGAALLLGSMGATAVLLFAVPHGTLSQPWSVLAGHTASALVGVTSARLIADPAIAAPVAVGLAIAAMHYLRAIHPPGGATALTAVIGGPKVAALGYQFVLTPVFLSALVMVVAAIAINSVFVWRRYPSAWGRPPVPAGAIPPDAPGLTHADFMAALSRIGTFVDISEDEFLRLQAVMTEVAASRLLAPHDIKLGHSYSNGAAGADWSVRRIVDEQPGSSEGRVIWRTVAGRGRDESGVSSRRDFAAWARYEVVRSNSTWVRPPPAAR